MATSIGCAIENSFQRDSFCRSLFSPRERIRECNTLSEHRHLMKMIFDFVRAARHLMKRRHLGS